MFQGQDRPACSIVAILESWATVALLAGQHDVCAVLRACLRIRVRSYGGGLAKPRHPEVYHQLAKLFCSPGSRPHPLPWVGLIPWPANIGGEGLSTICIVTKGESVTQMAVLHPGSTHCQTMLEPSTN